MMFSLAGQTLYLLFYGRGKGKGLESLASTTCSSHPDFGVAVLAHSLVHFVMGRRYNASLYGFFSPFKHGRLLPDEVCNVRSQLLGAQSGGEGPEFSSNASFIRLRQANTTPERSLERSDLSATSLRTYLDSDGRSEPQPKQNSIAKPDCANRAASYSCFPGKY